MFKVNKSKFSFVSSFYSEYLFYSFSLGGGLGPVVVPFELGLGLGPVVVFVVPLPQEPAGLTHPPVEFPVDGQGVPPVVTLGHPSTSFPWITQDVPGIASVPMLGQPPTAIP